MEVEENLIEVVEHTPILNHSIVKNSFDRLINLYKDPNSFKISIDKMDIKWVDKENDNFHVQNGNLKKSTFIKKSNSNFKNAKMNTNIDFLQQNFCDNECQYKFTEIMKKIKEGQIDINKIDWTSVRNTNVENQNLVQNLVNYYYTQGYNQGIQETSNQETK
jgi:hypothetical protein